MKTSKSVIAIGLIAVSLAGCSAIAPSTSADVAEVIEPYKADWIRAATTQSDCVDAWVFGKANGLDCYILADSVDSTTAIALDRLSSMAAPDGRESDFEALKVALKGASELKIRAACGTGSVPDLNLEKCAELVPKRVTALGELSQELTKWP